MHKTSRMMMIASMMAAVWGAASAAAPAPVKDALATPVWTVSPRAAWDNAAKRVDAEDLAADAAWRTCATPEAIRARQAVLHAAMLKAVGGFPARCPLDARVTGVVPRDGYRIEKVLFQSQPGLHVTALLFRPDGPGPFHALALACGHDDGGKGCPDYQRGAVMGAKSGFAVLVYDPFSQGERMQGKGTPPHVHGHNALGARAAMLGWSMARFRIWDAMRALDYLDSRADIVHDGYGFMGNSGGGTVTALTMALEPRVKAAAPSCFVTALRDVVADLGPQDAEQNVFGQLPAGLNHVGLVLLRAPSPVCMMCRQSDFFPLRGALATAGVARGVYDRLGAPDAFAMVDVPGPHGWVESTRTATMDWMTRWLKKTPGAFPSRPLGDYRLLDPGFPAPGTDLGLAIADCNVTPTGRVTDLPGERTAYGLMADELGSLEKARPTGLAAVRAAAVRLAGIRPAAARPAAVTRLAEAKGDGFVSQGLLFTVPGEPSVPAVLLTPARPAQLPPVLILPTNGRTSVVESVAGWLKAGCRVMVADLRGLGETGETPSDFYRSDRPEEGLAVLHYLLGESLVGKRAEDVLACAEELSRLSGGGRLDVEAFGRTAIPAAHARAAAPNLFGEIALRDAPPAWSAYVRDPSLRAAFTDVVVGALASYDWPALLGE